MSDFVPKSIGYLDVLASSGLSLKQIHLDDTLLDCLGVEKLIAAIGADLTTVYFGLRRRVDSLTLRQMATTCKKLQECSLACKANETQYVLAAFASSCLPLLETISVEEIDPDDHDDWTYHDNAAATELFDETALAIFQHHPKLLEFDAGLCIISPATCAKIIANSVKLDVNLNFVSGALGFEITEGCDDDPHLKYSELHLSQCEDGSMQFTSQMYLDCVLKVASLCVISVFDYSPVCQTMICLP